MSKYGFRKALLFTLVPLVCATIVMFFLAEIYLRHFSKFGYITPAIMRDRSLQYVPSIAARYVLDRKESHVKGWSDRQYYINAKGYRGRDFEFKKPTGTTRIIFFGGSAVFDVGVDHDWPHRVEEILRQNGFPNVEVINAGIPGSATFDSFGRFFAECHLMDPDYVVLYEAWNDFEYFRSDEPLLRVFKPYMPTEDPRLNYQNRVDKFICEHSQIYVRLRIHYYNWKYRVGPEGSKPKGKLGSEITDRALNQFRVNVEMFADLAKDINAVPVLMIEARLVSADNTDADKQKIQYQYALLDHEGLLKAFAETDEIIREIASEKNVYLIDASKEMTGRNEFFLDHVHLNEKGSEQLAQIVATELGKILKERDSDKSSK